ncbi:host cell division inhibitor Icd-like protein [Escherichia coli]|nr:host cell division inhibitor Icd-like protein [Escherichia coli]EEY2620388.1 host cell division inhibitor Icd-like protein [Escherichia coli]EFM4017245.1 host cell division inhibitor Icd-like protein [Escherichia coli]EGB0959371.1 host cell division inhibitor Icd-like protein [Escherichia coli]EIY1820409.1 host cell division inhibitor Icd-like protein [Escherichia coli]
MTHKTKATEGGRQWENTKHKPEHHSDLLAGGQCDQCAGLLVGYSCTLASPCCDVFQVCDPIFVRLYSFKNFSRTNAHGANLSCSCSLTAFLRCFFLDEDNFFNDLSVIVDTCNPVRHSSPHHGAGDGYSCSLALRRWRRLISPRMAALINCPVLSPSSFTFSMPSIISWAIRAVTDCDFAFFGPVAMSNSLCFWCKTIYTKKNYFEGLTCKTLLFYIVSYTLLMQGTETTKPRTVGAVTGLLTTNDSNSIEVAMLNHTTHPQGRDSHNLNKYIWRFIALSTAQPRVITIEATSEQEARQQSPAGCVMVFAARIRQGVSHA